jgi:hypothetical protein
LVLFPTAAELRMFLQPSAHLCVVRWVVTLVTSYRVVQLPEFEVFVTELVNPHRGYGELYMMEVCIPTIRNVCHLTGPFVTEQRSTADNYLNSLTNEMPLLMEDAPLGRRRGIFFEHDGEPPHFGQVTAYLNQRYENRWIVCRCPVTWPPRSPDLAPLGFSLLSLMKSMTYRTKVHARETPATDCGCCC